MIEAHIAAANGAAHGDDSALAIAVDPASGDAFAVGFVTVPTLFGTTERITTVGGPSDGFVWRVAEGTLLSRSALAIGGTGDARATSASIAASTLFVGGTHAGTTTLGGRSITSSGGTDGFVFYFDVGTSLSSIGITLGGPGDDAVAGLDSDADSLDVVGTIAPGVTQLGGFAVTLRGGRDGLGRGSQLVPEQEHPGLG